MDKKKIDKPDKVDELTANLIVLGSSNVKPLPNFVDYSIARNMIHRRPVDEKELKISINLKDVLNMEIHKLELSNNINNINNLMKNDYFNTLHKIFTKRLNDIIESEKALASEIEMIKQRIGLTDDEKKVFNSSGELPGTGNPDSSKSPVNEKKSPGLSKKIVVSGASLIGQSTKYLAHAGFSGLSYAWNKTVDTLNNDIKGNVKEAKFYSILHDTMKNIKNKNIEQIDTESRNAVINYSMFTNKIIPTIEWDTDSRALYNQKSINNLKGDNLSNMYKELSEKTAAEILPEFDSDKFWTKFGKIIKSSYNEVGRIQKFRFDCYTDFYNFLDKSEGIVGNFAKGDKDAQITLDRFKLYKSFIKDLIILERDNIILADCLENIVRSEKLHKIFTDMIEVNDEKYKGTQEQIILVIRDLYVNWVKVTLGLHSIWLNISEGKLLTPDNSKLLNSTSNITSEASRLKPYERQISRILLDIKMTSEGLSIINYLTNASEYPYTCLRILQDSSRVNIGLNETHFNAEMVFLGEMSTLTKDCLNFLEKIASDTIDTLEERYLLYLSDKVRYDEAIKNISIYSLYIGDDKPRGFVTNKNALSKEWEIFVSRFNFYSNESGKSSFKPLQDITHLKDEILASFEHHIFSRNPNYVKRAIRNSKALLGELIDIHEYSKIRLNYIVDRFKNSLSVPSRIAYSLELTALTLKLLLAFIINEFETETLFYRNYSDEQGKEFLKRVVNVFVMAILMDYMTHRFLNEKIGESFGEVTEVTDSVNLFLRTLFNDKYISKNYDNFMKKRSKGNESEDKWSWELEIEDQEEETELHSYIELEKVLVGDYLSRSEGLNRKLRTLNEFYENFPIDYMDDTYMKSKAITKV